MGDEVRQEVLSEFHPFGDELRRIGDELQPIRSELPPIAFELLPRPRKRRSVGGD